MKFYFEKYIINALHEMSLSFVIMAPCYCVESDSDISSRITKKKNTVVDLWGELHAVL